jgi:ferredoxin
MHPDKALDVARAGARGVVMSSWKLVIEPIVCDGHGVCGDLFPEGIEFDDWGFPMLSDDAIPDGLVTRARHAVRMCPTLALRLERVVIQEGVGSPARRP